MTNIKKIIFISMLLIVLEFTVFSSVSLYGPTGFLNVPSPETAPPKTFTGGISYQSYGFGGNTNYSLVSFKGTVGISENFEVGFEKTTDSGTLMKDPGMVVTAKAGWKVSNDISVAGGLLLDTTSGNASSVYGVVGAGVAFFGMGFNFGADKGATFSTAKMGGYDFTDNEPDNVFFMAGAKFTFGEGGALTVSYNGDAVGIGFHAELDDEDNQKSAVEVGWIIESDYEDLYKKYLNNKYEKNKLFIGISGEF
jgi:hypothetical protein